MSSITCPYCGQVMNAPIKFCTGCRRAVKKEDAQNSGLRGRKFSSYHEDGAEAEFAVSRSDHSTHRRLRNVFYTMSTVLLILIVYYCTMKYFLHEHMPGNLDVKLDEIIGRAVPGL